MSDRSVKMGVDYSLKTRVEEEGRKRGLQAKLAALLLEYDEQKDSGSSCHSLADYLIECLTTFKKIMKERGML